MDTKNKLKKQVKLRPAKKEDCKRLFFLFNDSTVRNNSLSLDKVEYKNHKAWFTSRLEDPDTILLVATIEDSFVGQVRFDIDADRALTSISIHKRFRGYGLGKVLLKDSLAYLKKKHPKIKFAVGQIKPSNIAAIKNTEFVGFKFDKTVEAKGVTVKQYLYDLKKE